MNAVARGVQKNRGCLCRDWRTYWPAHAFSKIKHPYLPLSVMYADLEEAGLYIHLTLRRAGYPQRQV